MNRVTLLAVLFMLGPGFAAARAQTPPKNQTSSAPRKRAPKKVRLPEEPTQPKTQNPPPAVSDPADAIPFVDVQPEGGGPSVRFRTPSLSQAELQNVAQKTAKIFGFYSQTYGPLASVSIELIERGTAGDQPLEKFGRLFFYKEELTPKALETALPQKLAELWWGQKVKEAAQTDRWFFKGMALLSSYFYLESQGNAQITQAALTNMRTRALMFSSEDNEGGRLADLWSLDPGTPNRPNPIYEGGVNRAAVMLHQLRTVVGPNIFKQALQTLVVNPGNDPVSTERVQKLFEAANEQQLSAYFGDWVNSNTQAETKIDVDATISRLEAGGFQIEGTILQPDANELSKTSVELEIPLEKGSPTTVPQKISGTETPFKIPLAVRPLNVAVNIDGNPERSDPQAILRAEMLAAEGFLKSYHAARQEKDTQSARAYLEDAKRVLFTAYGQKKDSSLVLFHIGQFFFIQDPPDIEVAFARFSNAVKFCDHSPAWTVTWSLLYLGKLADLYGNRQVALKYYGDAVSDGADPAAAELAQRYIKTPYQKEENPTPLTPVTDNWDVSPQQQNPGGGDRPKLQTTPKQAPQADPPGSQKEP